MFFKFVIDANIVGGMSAITYLTPSYKDIIAFAVLPYPAPISKNSNIFFIEIDNFL